MEKSKYFHTLIEILSNSKAIHSFLQQNGPKGYCQPAFLYRGKGVES